MSNFKKLVAQFMSELAKFEATTTQEPITADEFSPEELADLTKVRNMGAKIRAKITANATPNTEIPKLEAVAIPQPEDKPEMTKMANDEGCDFELNKLVKLDIEGCMPHTVIFKTPSGEELGKISIKPGDEEPFCWTTKLDPKKLSVVEPITEENNGKLKIIAHIKGITKAQKVVNQRQEISFEHCPKTTIYNPFTVETRWFGDGEKEFVILVNGASNDEEGGKPKYWGIDLREKIKDETGADLSDTHTPSAEFIDGEPGCILCPLNMDATPSGRTEKGIAKARLEAFGIFDKLKRDPNTGKIIQKIQMYTHSKGAAFGDGYIDELKHQAQIYHKKYDNIFADIDHFIDIVIDLDAHQSSHIHKNQANYPNIAIAHGNGIADANQTGDVIGFDRCAPSKIGLGRGAIGGHDNNTFSKELDMVLDQHNKNEFSENPDKYEGFENLFDDDDKKNGVLTEVNKPNSLKPKTTHKNPDEDNWNEDNWRRKNNYIQNKL